MDNKVLGILVIIICALALWHDYRISRLWAIFDSMATDMVKMLTLLDKKGIIRTVEIEELTRGEVNEHIHKLRRITGRKK